MNLVMLILTSLMMFSHTILSISFEELQNFLIESIPQHHRGKRFINAQEYLNVWDMPRYLVRIGRLDSSTNYTNSKNKTRSPELKTICSGSIVSKNLVMTSAGCLHEVTTRWTKVRLPIPTWQLQVVAGDYNTSVVDVSEQLRTPIQIYMHPRAEMVDYRQMWLNDIAIIQVDKDFEFSATIGPIDLWFGKFAVNSSYTSSYIMVKASGYGDGGSRKSVAYEDLFDTYYDHQQARPGYAYYVMLRENNGVQSCQYKFENTKDTETKIMRNRPQDGLARQSLEYSGRRCFYTAATKIVPYQTTNGDWGGPITFNNVDNHREYQVYLIPWQPAEKSSFENDRNYHVWGENIGVYRRFIGRVFEAALQHDSDFYAPKLVATDKKQTHTKTADFSYFQYYTYYVDVNFPLATNHSGNVNITLVGTNAVSAMINAEVNIRNSETKELIKHYSGKEQVQVTEAVAVPSFSKDPVPPARWTCPTLNAPGLKKPSQNEKLDFDTLYTCGVVDGDKANVGEPLGEPGNETRYGSIVYTSPWNVLEFENPDNVNITIEFVLRSELDARDKGSITLTVDYISASIKTYNETLCERGQIEYCAETEKEVSSTCDVGYRICDDGLSCVNLDLVCDGNADCVDGNDESFWCLDEKCIASEFQCLTGECLRLHYLCDGRCDCRDQTVCEDETLFCADNSADYMNKQFMLNPKKYEEQKKKKASSASTLLLNLFLCLGLIIFQI